MLLTTYHWFIVYYIISVITEKMDTKTVFPESYTWLVVFKSISRLFEQ